MPKYNVAGTRTDSDYDDEGEGEKLDEDSMNTFLISPRPKEQDSSAEDLCKDIEVPSLEEFPMLRFLDIKDDWFKANVPKFKPIGTRRRIQAVVEMVYLESSDDEDDEDAKGYSLDDLKCGHAIYDEFSDNIKKQAAKVILKKDPNETFMEDPEEKGIQLAAIKVPEINAEDDDDILMMSEIVRNKIANEIPKDSGISLMPNMKIEEDISSFPVQKVMESTTFPFDDPRVHNQLFSKLTASLRSTILENWAFGSPRKYFQVDKEDANGNVWKLGIPKYSAFSEKDISHSSKSLPKLHPVQPTGNYSNKLARIKLIKSSKIVPFKPRTVKIDEHTSSAAGTSLTDIKFKARYVTKSAPNNLSSNARHATAKSVTKMLAIKPLKRL